MFVLKSTHQKALDEIDLLRTELAVARTAERSIDERLVTVRESHNKLIHENACLTALCQYLPAGVYHIHYDASHTFGRKTSHVVYNTSVTVDHKAAKNANRNYTIVHEPLTRIVKQDELTDQLLTLVARQEFVKVKRDRVYKKISMCQPYGITLGLHIALLTQIGYYENEINSLQSQINKVKKELANL